MTDQWNIGIDIGGTNVKIGIVNQAGFVLDTISLPTENTDDVPDFSAGLRDKTQALLAKNTLALEDIGHIGVGVPGTVDNATGFVQFCPNIPWIDVPLGNILKQSFKRDVMIDHDVRLAALAEMKFGAGRGFSDILCVVIGTGIGAGLIINGSIYRGALNTAGELGHMIVEKQGRPCACGQAGCLERYASGTGILECALEVLDADEFGDRIPSAQAVFQLAEEGSDKAMRIVQESLGYLGLGIANAVNLLSPELVIVGGGVAQNGNLFLDTLKKQVYRYGFRSWTNQNKLAIRKADLGTDSVLIGAASMCNGDSPQCTKVHN